MERGCRRRPEKAIWRIRTAVAGRLWPSVCPKKQANSEIRLWPRLTFRPAMAMDGTRWEPFAQGLEARGDYKSRRARIQQ
ncbi:hypothetical protein V2G26_004507 [Clonostachys chloroleuca]